MRFPLVSLFLMLLLVCPANVSGQFTEQQLGNWLARFPDADADGDGRLTVQEVQAYQRKRKSRMAPAGKTSGAPREFKVDPGWDADRFPDEAICYRTPQGDCGASHPRQRHLTHPKPVDGSLRIVGTGHSFMAPGYRTFPRSPARPDSGSRRCSLTRAAASRAALGTSGSRRTESSSSTADPQPKLLASIANAKWDAMMWGPYFNDRPAYYACWIDFCLKYNPDMKFYLSDAWPQLGSTG